MVDEFTKRRLRAAGDRLDAANLERDAALLELKQALAEADGGITDQEAAELTHLSEAAAHIFKSPPENDKRS